MEPKYKKLLWISIGLSLVVLLIVIILTFNEETIEALKNLQPQYLLFALGLHILALVFWGLRIKFLSLSLGYKVPTFHCVNMAAAGQLLASITPSNIGGEPVRIHELYKAKIPIADSTAIVLVERLLEAFLLVFGVIIGMTTFSIIYSNGEIPQAVLTAAWFGTGFFVAILFILILMMRKPAIIKKIGLKITGLITKKMSEQNREKVKGDVVNGIDQFYATFRHFAGKARWGLVVGLIFSFGFWACEYAIASVILMGLGYEPNLLLSIIFQLIIAVILMIPLTPGSAGIAELCYTAFYSLIIPTSVIGLFVVLLRMILYYSNLLLGFIASFIIVRREARNKEVVLNE